MLEVPGLAGFAVSEQLQRVVSKARQSRALPPPSALTSPLPRPQALPLELEAESSVPVSRFDSLADLALDADIQLASTFEWAEGWDFTFAEELFSAVTAQAPTSTHVSLWCRYDQTFI